MANTGNPGVSHVLCFHYVTEFMKDKTIFNTMRTGAFKLFKCTFPGSKQFKSTFILCFFLNL